MPNFPNTVPKAPDVGVECRPGENEMKTEPSPFSWGVLRLLKESWAQCEVKLVSDVHQLTLFMRLIF